MTTARDIIMTSDTECADVNRNVTEAARKMRDLGVGALPICGDGDRLKGTITDCDIVRHCAAEGRNAHKVKVEEYARDRVITVGADDLIEDALRTMARAGVRRLPAIDGHDLVGRVSQADIARNLRRDDGRPRGSHLLGALELIAEHGTELAWRERT